MSRHASEVFIVRTGSANLASVCAAVRRIGAVPIITEDPEVVRHAALVVLPGVGAFGPAMLRLQSLGLDGSLRERAMQGRPLLAICLGMQLLLSSSDESPGVPGLGVAAGELQRFAPGVRVPQMGWNEIVAQPGARLLSDAQVYFANSYRLSTIPEGWTGAMAEHGEGFVAAIERGETLACQFHPELSGPAGLSLMKRWIEASIGAGVSRC